MEKETVNHPAHYNTKSVECIDIVEHFSFNIGNAIKHIWRAGEKGSAKEDYAKALWYLERASNINEDRIIQKPIETIRGLNAVALEFGAPQQEVFLNIALFAATAVEMYLDSAKTTIRNHLETL